MQQTVTSWHKGYHFQRRLTTENGPGSLGSPQNLFQNVREATSRKAESGFRIGRKPLLELLGWREVVANEADVLRAERGNVGEQRLG